MNIGARLSKIILATFGDGMLESVCVCLSVHLVGFHCTVQLVHRVHMVLKKQQQKTGNDGAPLSRPGSVRILAMVFESLGTS